MRVIENNINKAKMYQLALFPFNNGATNIYYVLTATYIAYYGNGVLGLALLFATTMVTAMRLFDAVTDPIIGALIDKTNTRFGKFRPYMVLGNLVMAVSTILLYFGTRLIPEESVAFKYAAYVVIYAIYVIGYTLQTSCTRSGQSVLTNDPEQRPMFTAFNLVASMIGMGAIQFLAPIIRANFGDYTTASFYDVIIPISIVLSAIMTVLAVIGIWEKDNERNFGLAGGGQQKIKIREYVEIIKNNSPLKRLMVAGAGCKLALSIAMNGTVLCMLYGSMMGDYNGLYLPMMIIGYVFSVPFFAITIRTSQKKGQKASFMRYISLALVMYVGVLVLMIMWKQGVPALNLSLYSNGRITINLYTVLFILFFGVGYGAYYATADMPIPMVADCADYETYRSGKFVPGIMGTLFSLVDKLVSSLSSTIVGMAVAMIGLKTLPGGDTEYAAGMKIVVIVLFCIIPMIAWAISLIAMKGYILTGDKMKQIQKVNAERLQALSEGKSVEDVMNNIK